eukprot:362622-Chlamydomonas_euryale.AAC.2
MAHATQPRTKPRNATLHHTHTSLSPTHGHATLQHPAPHVAMPRFSGHRGQLQDVAVQLRTS